MPRPRRRARRVWGFLPTKSEAQRLALLLAAVGAWLDARCNPDPRTEAVAALAVTGVETDAAVAESLAVMKKRLERVERAIRSDHAWGAEPSRTSPAPAKPKGLTGWLSGLLGHRDGRKRD